MAYVATNAFKFARDFIGVDTIAVPAGEIDTEALCLNSEHINFLIDNELIDEVGLVEDNFVEFEIDNSAEAVVTNLIAEANAFNRRKALDKWAADKHDIELDAGDSLREMKEQFATKIAKKHENKMMGELENK